jgi:16S rRNA (uracil1498-N3)-methyltransferase
VISIPSRESLRLILWEKGGRRLREVLKESKGGGEVFFLVGPEGGLSEEEVEEAKNKSFVPVTLGERILRAETASLCLLSILQYEWGDIG